MPWSLVQIQDAPPTFTAFNVFEVSEGCPPKPWQRRMVFPSWFQVLPDKPKDFKAAFEKKTQKTLKHDIDTARTGYAEMQEERKLYKKGKENAKS